MPPAPPSILELLPSLLPDLERRVGTDWPSVLARLEPLLAPDQVSPSPQHAQVLVLALLLPYPEAHRFLVASLATTPPDPTTRSGTVEPTFVERSVDIACPSRVGHRVPRFTAVVRLRRPLEATDEQRERLRMAVENPVYIRLEAPEFDLLSEPEQSVVVKLEADSPPAAFDLRPIRTGHHQLTFKMFQDGGFLGASTVPVEVTARDLVEVACVTPGRRLAFIPEVPPPDLTLEITLRRDSGRQALSFALRRRAGVEEEFPEVPLECRPSVYAERLFQRLSRYRPAAEPASSSGMERDIDLLARNLGQNLWKHLVPERLKALYEAERSTWRDATLLILSDEPYFPWELIWPYRPGGWEDEAPWCITTRLTRWLQRDPQGNGHAAPPTDLPFRSIACLAPVDSGLPAAQEERAFIADLARSHNLQDLGPLRSTLPAATAILEEGQYDWLHVASHGSFDSENPDADAALFLEDRQSLTADCIIGSRIEGHILRRRPAFFFNACHTGRQAFNLTRLGGWANTLISAGAGTFLAPQWAVNDRLALDFARNFYRSLLSGETLSNALRDGRLQARKEGHPTWLAYSAYGHPNARVRGEPPVTTREAEAGHRDHSGTGGAPCAGSV